MSNQFNSYRAPDHVPLIVAHSATAATRINAAKKLYETNPAACIVTESDRIFARTPAGRVAASYRALIWYAFGNLLPAFGFGTTTCGNSSCINPDHQKPVAEEEDFLAFAPPVRPDDVTIPFHQLDTSVKA